MRKITVAVLLVGAVLVGHVAHRVADRNEAWTTGGGLNEPASADRLLVQVGLGQDWKELKTRKMTERDDWYLICDDQLYANQGGRLKDVVAEAESYSCVNWVVAVDESESTDG